MVSNILLPVILAFQIFQRIKEEIMNAKEMFKLFSLLLQYPDDEICSIQYKDDISQINDLQIVSNMEKFGDYFFNTDNNKLREEYVETFDFNDKTNLFLTYSKLKDEKERGQVLVELKDMYEKTGLILDSTELPDYLPLFLEFISLADNEVALDLLHRFKGMIENIHKGLKEANSPYAYLVKALLLDIDHFISKGGL